MRILQIVSSLSIGSGVMSVLMNYYRNIDREKIQFDFLCMRKKSPSYEKEIESLGGRCFCLGVITFSPKTQKRLFSFFRQHTGEWAAIHCNAIYMPEIYGLAAKSSGIHHVIAHSHSTGYGSKAFSSIRNYIVNSFVGLFATDYMACSDEAAHIYRKRKALILRNAIDTERFTFSAEKRASVRSELSIDEDSMVFVNVARLEAVKNPLFLIRCFEPVLQENPSARLILVGDGSMRSDIVGYCEANCLGQNVICTGNRADIPDLLSAADVFVMPSLVEGFPVSAVEAQATGLPCILSSSIPRSVDVGLCSFLPIDDIQPWVQKMTSIKANPERLIGKSLVEQAGLGIRSVSAVLQDFYMSLG